VQEPIPANPTWNNIVLNPGVFGTVTVAPGMTAVINSEACPTTAEGGLAFVFSYADWITEPASVGWTEYLGMERVGMRGVYLTYDC